MPTIIGSKSGTRPYLELDWTETSQDIANNRTRLNLKLYLRVEYPIGYNARYSGKLQGASFTASAGYIGTSGRYLLHERNIWVNHNSDGKKSVTLSADYDISIRWSGTYYSNITLSGSASLTDIPRQSLLNSASISNLKASSSTTLSIGRTVYHSGFYHLVSIYDGNTWIWDSGYFSGTPDTAYTIPSATVNNMLARMPTATSKTFTVRMRTYTSSGGSGLIGTQSRNVTVGIDSSVKPSISNVNISVAGSGHDNALGMYVQRISKVKVSFSRNAGYGATLQSTKSIVRKVGGEDSQTINSNDGTTGRAVSLNGQYEVYAEVRDSRGRGEYILLGNFIVEYYKTPVIDTFKASRRQESPLVVNIVGTGSYAPVKKYNNLTINIQRRLGSGSWSNVGSDTVTTDEIYSASATSTGNEVTNTYNFKLRVTDSFGNFAESVVTVPTQRVVLDIHKNWGVGIGKIHEKGTLDVDGSAYFRGDLHVNGVNITNAQLISEMGTTADTIAFWDRLPQGIYHVYPNQIPNQPSDFGIMYHSRRGGDFFSTMWYSQPNGTIYRKSGNALQMSLWTPIDRPDTGTNDNGRWVRFNDGTQICNGLLVHDFGANIDAFATLPNAFFNTEYTVSISSATSSWQPTEITRNVGVAINTTSQVRFNAQRNLITGTYAYRYLAVGRWR